MDDGAAPELLRFAEGGDLNSVTGMLLGETDPDVRDSCQWTALMKAALNGHLDIVVQLLDAGAEIDAVDKGGYTAMMLAASNNHADVVRLLLERGAMVDHQEATHGWTALIWAVKLRHRETVEVLLADEADQTLPDFSGRSAEAWAEELALGEREKVLATGRSRLRHPDL